MFLKFWGIQRFACYPLQSTVLMYFGLYKEGTLEIFLTILCICLI